VWDVVSGRLLRTLEGHIGSINAVAVTPDGKVVSASSDRTLKLWDLASGELLRTLEGHTQEVHTVAVTPDGRAVSGAGNCNDCTLKVWDLASGELLRTLEGHRERVDVVAVTADGTRSRVQPTCPSKCGTSIRYSPPHSGRAFQHGLDVRLRQSPRSDARRQSGFGIR